MDTAFFLLISEQWECAKFHIYNLVLTQQTEHTPKRQLKIKTTEIFRRLLSPDIYVRQHGVVYVVSFQLTKS